MQKGNKPVAYSMGGIPFKTDVAFFVPLNNSTIRLLKNRPRVPDYRKYWANVIDQIRVRTLDDGWRLDPGQSADRRLLEPIKTSTPLFRFKYSLCPQPYILNQDIDNWNSQDTDCNSQCVLRMIVLPVADVTLLLILIYAQCNHNL